MELMPGMIEVIGNDLHGWDVVRYRKIDLVVSGADFFILCAEALRGGGVFMTKY